jgi:hypothetical protein
MNLHSLILVLALAGVLSGCASTMSVGDFTQLPSFIPTKTVSDRLNLASNESPGWKYRAHRDKADYDICYMIAESADPEGTYLTEAKLRRLDCAEGVTLGKAVSRSSSPSTSSDSLNETQITKAEPKSVEPTKQSKMEGYTGGSTLRIIHASSYQGDGIVEGIVDVKEVSEILVNGKTTPFDNLGKFLGFIKTPPNNLEIKALLHDGGSYSLMYEVTVLPEDINDAEEQPETIDFGWLDSLIERDRAIKESEEKENLELKRRREFRERLTTELCKSLNQNHQFSK